MFGSMLISDVGAGGITYATWNPLDKHADVTLSGGNLIATNTVNILYRMVRANIGKTTGKWYIEITLNTEGSGFGITVGSDDGNGSLANYAGSAVQGWGYNRLATGNKYNNGTGSAFGTVLSASDIASIALDAGAGKIWFARNGTWQASGNPGAGTNPAFTGLTGTQYMAVSLFNLNDKVTANFGASAFTYTVPTGFNSGLF